MSEKKIIGVFKTDFIERKSNLDHQHWVDFFNQFKDFFEKNSLILCDTIEHTSEIWIRFDPLNSEKYNKESIELLKTFANKWEMRIRTQLIVRRPINRFTGYPCETYFLIIDENTEKYRKSKYFFLIKKKFSEKKTKLIFAKIFFVIFIIISACLFQQLKEEEDPFRLTNKIYQWMIQKKIK